MQPEKGIFVKEISDGQLVEGLFMIREASRAETRTGAPYLMLKVMDSSGEMAGRVWEDAERLLPLCEPGRVVRLTGQAQAYKGVMQLKVNRIAPVDTAGVDLSLFLPATGGDIDLMGKDLLKLVKSVTDPHLRELLKGFFHDRQFFEAFRQAPAAKRLHHACIGGLLEHTLAVARLADAIAPLYPAIDRSLLMAGALLHDIGKVKEFSFEIHPFDYTDSGRLMGHLVLGVEMIQERLNRLGDFPAELAVRLKHLVLSHHGRHEFGSPALPMMTEAFVLHYLDDLDAKMNHLDRLAGEMREPGYQWSDFQRTLERFIFVKGRPQGEETEVEKTQGSQTREPEGPVRLQPSLFS